MPCVLRLTVTLFSWNKFPSSEGLTCKNCDDSTADCRSGSISNEKPCTSYGQYEMSCVSLEKPNNVVLRGCAVKNSTRSVCHILQQRDATYRNCKECDYPNMCNSHNHGS
ncbi:uncharacterized protein LOC116169932 isoform X2 [Photinus pyralis]|uniref:uncharacterized protein LOC116169932 isoform X2 n=1 Tax=Photinus pyralis TaxID=7054 RepID=UPI001267806C|nr:uncharacterized protein LOC116169932 isoform X2 [Photinus pyralis]